MWTTSFRNREIEDDCPHDSITATANYGLQRTVCGSCGHVSVGYLHDVFEGYDLGTPMADGQPADDGATTSS